MKKNKKEKKARKEMKNTRVLVNEAFGNKKTKAKNNKLVESLVKSVMLNKAVIKKDKKQLLEWQNNYYQDLFSKFKQLIVDHNKIFQFKADDLINKIELKKSELKKLNAEIQKLEAEKELKKHV